MKMVFHLLRSFDLLGPHLQQSLPPLFGNARLKNMFKDADNGHRTTAQQLVAVKASTSEDGLAQWQRKEDGVSYSYSANGVILQNMPSHYSSFLYCFLCLAGLHSLHIELLESIQIIVDILVAIVLHHSPKAGRSRVSTASSAERPIPLHGGRCNAIRSGDMLKKVDAGDG